MQVSYIYDTYGKPEYVVVPISDWYRLEKSNSINVNGIKNEKMNDFDPEKFKGILTGINLDLEAEIAGMRNEWTRDI
jgi:hypothetical protein